VRKRKRARFRVRLTAISGTAEAAGNFAAFIDYRQAPGAAFETL
jgi:hypothetical protein